MEITAIAASVIAVLVQTLLIYSYLLLIRVLLSWIPNLDWSNPIVSSLTAITDPYLNVFRGIIPPLGGLDLSPILAFVLINVLRDLLGGALVAFTSTSFAYLN